MGTYEFNRYGERKKDCRKFQSAEGVATEVLEIIQRMKYLEDKDCFYYRSEFERFRDDLDRKDSSRCWESTSFILYKLSNVWIPVTLLLPVIFRIHK